MDEKIMHICEVCGRTEIMTQEETFEDDWDYPTRMGTFGVVSQRICGDCPIIFNAWWALVCEKKGINELSQKRKKQKEDSGRAGKALICG